MWTPTTKQKPPTKKSRKRKDVGSLRTSRWQNDKPLLAQKTFECYPVWSCDGYVFFFNILK
jgi:hypothetical protein